MKIWTDRPMGIKEALEFMTDDWIEADSYCQMTVQTLRDACLELLNASQPDVEAETCRCADPDKELIPTPVGYCKKCNKRIRTA